MESIKAGIFVATSMSNDNSNNMFGQPLSICDVRKRLNINVHIKINISNDFKEWDNKIILYIKTESDINSKASRLILYKGTIEGILNDAKKTSESDSGDEMKSISGYNISVNVINIFTNVPLNGTGAYEFVLECLKNDKTNIILDTWQFRAEELE